MCPHCGVMVEAVTLTCRFCGYSVRRDYEPEEPKAAPPGPPDYVQRQRAGAETSADY